MLLKMWSDRCAYNMYWDENKKQCLDCAVRFKIKAGFKFAPNCGLSDDGSQHVSPYIKCTSDTFNNGSFLDCQKCSSMCASGRLLSECTATSDRRCCPAEQHNQKCREEFGPTTASRFTTSQVRASSTVTSTESLYTTSTNSASTTASSTESPVTTSGTGNEYISKSTLIYTSQAETAIPRVTAQTNFNHNPWVGFGAVIFIILLCVALYSLFHIIRKRKHHSCRGMKRRVSRISVKTHEPLEDKHLHSKENSVEDLRSLLSAEIQTAPLQTVLNNLDVVEELIVLLDPETPGMKNTRHLAASCSLTFTWINYTYSMKDSRSPLIAVLEKVIAKHPYWNVGHLVDLLSKIGRNDAVAVLAKLSVTAEEV